MSASTEASKEAEGVWTERGLTRIPYHLQLFGGFLLLQGIVLVASLAIVGRTQTREVERNIQARLEVARDVFLSFLRRRNQQLAESLELLGMDYAIKQAVATRDDDTIRSVAMNLRRRSGADLLWIQDRKGRVYGDPPQALEAALQAAKEDILQGALARRPGSGLRALGGAPYQVAAVPLAAPDVIGALAAAYGIDDEEAAEIKQLTRSDVSFAAGGRIVSSTLDPRGLEVLRSGLGALRAGRVDSIGPRGMRQIVLPVDLSGGVTAYVQYPLDQELEPLEALQRMLTLVGLVGFCLSAIMGYWIADWVTGAMRGLIASLQAANKKLVQFDQFKTQFFSMVSHDLKNPISSILGYTWLIEEKFKDEALKNFIEPMRNSATVMDRLATDLIDFAAIENGTLRMRPGPMDLMQVVRDIQGRMQVIAKRAGLDFRVESRLESLPMTGDAVRIAQALQNLCGNAMHYTPSGGSVTLRVDEADGRARVSVRDTGIGISKEDLPKVFQRFFQAANAREVRNGGLGLGLKIVREIARAHRGSIEVDSELGKGSTFTLVLPLDGAPADG